MSAMIVGIFFSEGMAVYTNSLFSLPSNNGVASKKIYLSRDWLNVGISDTWPVSA